MRKEISPDSFDSHDEYIQKLGGENPLVLSRKNLLDLADAHMGASVERHDLGHAQEAVRLLQLANNIAASKGEAAMAAAQAAIQVLADEEEKATIDHILQNMQEQKRKNIEGMLGYGEEDDTDAE